MMYKCSAELEAVHPVSGGPAGRYFDLSNQLPGPDDFELARPCLRSDSDAPPRSRRVTCDPVYWAGRAADSQQLPPPASPRTPASRRPAEHGQEGGEKSRRIDEDVEPAVPDSDLDSYAPSLPALPPEDNPMPDQEGVASSSVPQDRDTPAQEGELVPQSVPEQAVGEVSVSQSEPKRLCVLNLEKQVCEISFDILATDIQEDLFCLWTALEECAEVRTKPAQKRRVEVAFRKLGPDDQAKFRQAMSKEWNSWLENKVTTIVKAKGVDRNRIIGSRWVLTWKQSSDPDDPRLTPEARLVLVGYKDPDLGRIATDSPTLRTESKHIILSLRAANHWELWRADIKTAFLSGFR